MVRQRELTAYHEAGHAVAALTLRMTVTIVTIRDDPRAMERGSVTLARSVIDRLTQEDYTGGTRWRSAYAVQNAAGVMAETLRAKARPATLAELQHSGNRGDYNSMVEAARNVAGDARVALFIVRVMRRAERIVRRHWPSVECIAALLQERETLSGREVARAIRNQLSG
jgi:ATP-dependent Zn protease